MEPLNGPESLPVHAEVIEAELQPLSEKQTFDLLNEVDNFVAGYDDDFDRYEVPVAPGIDTVFQEYVESTAAIDEKGREVQLEQMLSVVTTEFKDDPELLRVKSVDVTDSYVTKLKVDDAANEGDEPAFVGEKLSFRELYTIQTRRDGSYAAYIEQFDVENLTNSSAADMQRRPMTGYDAQQLLQRLRLTVEV
ncbi:MAG: hypothetical protein ABIR91_03085 [Candidatus Saccharimonadales bacterium]